MKQIMNYRKLGGYLFFLIAIGLFYLQMIYFILHSRFNVEYQIIVFFIF